MRRDLKGPAFAPAVGWSRRFTPGREGASPGATADRARRHRDGGTARIALLALACGLLAMLLMAGTAGAAAPTVDPSSPFDGSGTPARSMTPTFVSVSQRSGDVYVIDSAHDAVDVFDANGTYVTQILGSSTDARSFSFGGADDIAVDNSGGATDGNVYVASENGGHVFAFNSSGTFLWQSNAGVSDLCGVAVDLSGNPWIGDYSNGVQKLRASDGSLAGTTLVAPGDSCNIAFDSVGNLALHHFNGSVDIIDPSGTLLHSDNSGIINTDVAVETVTNSVYTVDAGGVTIWDSSGSVVAGTPFDPEGGSDNSVAVNSANGKIYITVPSQGRVDIYDLQLFTLGATVNGTGSGRVDADVGQISGCTSAGGSNCSDRYIAGSTIQLVATPPADGTSTFTGWTNCDNPSGNICTVSLTSDRTVTATFDLVPTPSLRVHLSGTGSGTVTSAPSGIDCGSTCQHDFLQGTLILLTPRAATGSTFTGWSGGGCSGTGQCQLTLNTGTDVTATFTQSPPTATTGGASSVTQSSATLAGSVNPNGAATTCTFQYGTSTAYGSSVPCASAPGSGTSVAVASAGLSGLAAGTTYHYRIVASNAGGTSNGGDATFTTAPPNRTCQTDPTLCPGVLRLAKAVATASGGKVVVQLSCVGGTSCRASLQVTAKVKTTRGKGKSRRTRTVTVVVAKGSVQLGAGRSGRATLRLTRTGRQLLARSRQLKTTIAGGGIRHALVIRNSVKKKSRRRH